MQISPTDIRLSPVHDELQKLSACWNIVANMPVAVDFGNPASERSTAEHLGLCDVSWRPCLTLKGADAAAFLDSKNLPVPQAIMQVTGLESGGILARTGSREFFLEDGTPGELVAQLLTDLNAGVGNCFSTLRQDASFLISGRQAAAMLLQTCAYDFRQPHDRIVMTRVAGVSSYILHRVFQGISVFQLWFDGTYGSYLWNTLHEILDDFGGVVVGAAVFFPEIVSNT
jgi:sarcosine oxidase, subunit gamma